MAGRGGPPPWDQRGGPGQGQLPPQVLAALQQQQAIEAMREGPTLEQRFRLDAVQLAIAWAQAVAQAGAEGVVTGEELVETADRINRFITGEREDEGGEAGEDNAETDRNQLLLG